MGNILALNTGSTSIKYKLFDQDYNELSSDVIEHVDDYDSVIKKILRQITNSGEISAVGHRIVHGGEVFFEPTVLNDKIIQELEKNNSLAPLHNLYNLAGVKAAISFLPEIPQVGIFDTAFYASLPEYAKNYALPKKIINGSKIHRYGFHGISHEYSMNEAARKSDIKPEKLNMISCHLGGGSSVAAIKNGKPIDISSGYTPTEGLMMMTRTGDLDPGVVIELMRSQSIENENDKNIADQIRDLINKDSGIKGLCGIDDYRELIKQVSLGNEDACLAFEMFIYRIIKYIGSYWFALGGKVDVISFTGAIGAGHPLTRETIMRRLKFLGKVDFLSIQPNEELMIAAKTKTFIERK